MTATRQNTTIRLRPDVVFTNRDGAVRMTSPVGSYAIRGATDAVVAALRELAHAPHESAASADLAEHEEQQLHTILDRVYPLWVRGVTARDGRMLATIEVTAPGAHYTPTTVTPDVLLRLSRFALLRVHAGLLVVESPLVKYRIRLVDAAAAALVSALGEPRRAKDLSSPVLTSSEVMCLLGHLVSAGFVEIGHTDHRGATFASDNDPTLRQWDFHDLLSHSRSRMGRFDQPFGGVYPYIGEIEAQPSAKPIPTGSTIALHRPSLAGVLAHDAPLTTVLEGRRSIRHYGEQPLTARQLGEFLYRTARVRAASRPGDGTHYAMTTRPYPCGGAAYELELYITVRRCDGIEPGSYYYDPVGHQVILVNDNPSDQTAMLRTASLSTGGQAEPDILITITSRFQRLSWKYRGIAYAVSLKHSGVLYQTMYLVATSMGLAPCGLGSGDSDLTARVLGLDYLRESSIGDFILGSSPLPDPTRPDPERDWRPVNSFDWTVMSRSALGRLHTGAET